ncbi:uncharacterized protein LOC126683202 [Mercurialis annua]|uniref:uncharacterized protein LOC126683202 n=1 Tax=Mercurialis annua TaxID=3986 RepID=UPI0021600182|nr:uncharacterized protein LOC126683202 [Mercurialis annua]
MSGGPPRVRPMNIAGPENKAPQKPGKKAETEAKKNGKVTAVLRQKSMNGSCSSEASSDSSHSRASSSSSSRSGGKLAAAAAGRRNGVVRKKQCEVAMKIEKGGGGDDAAAENGNVVGGGGGNGGMLEDKVGCLEVKKRCSWITPSTDPCYATFHDQEWGVPVHDDWKLFELLSLSGALAELTWPVILHKRNMFREVFFDFDPIAVSKLNDKKIAAPGSPASTLLSELKLRSITENARQICKVVEEFGSFDKYIWNFLNHKPIVNQFRYSRQVPVKTSKAEFISKDLIKRGFRSVGPTVIYSFMQVAGLTNDHLIGCFRYQDCVFGTEVREKDDGLKFKTESKNTIDVGLPIVLDCYNSS